MCYRKQQLVQDLIPPPGINIHMCTLYTYTNIFMPRFSPSGFFVLSRCLIPTPQASFDHPRCFRPHTLCTWSALETWPSGSLHQEFNFCHVIARVFLSVLSPFLSLKKTILLKAFVSWLCKFVFVYTFGCVYVYTIKDVSRQDEVSIPWHNHLNIYTITYTHKGEFTSYRYTQSHIHTKTNSLGTDIHNYI